MKEKTQQHQRLWAGQGPSIVGIPSGRPRVGADCSPCRRLTWGSASPTRRGMQCWDRLPRLPALRIGGGQLDDDADHVMDQLLAELRDVG